jgi:dipeptidase E
MRLYLSSFRVGDHPDALVDLVRRDGLGRPLAVIGNAVDGAPAARRLESVRAEIAALAGIGLGAEELDLRDYDGAQVARLAGDLEPFAGVWARGGNVFTLRERMRASGADRVLVDLLERDTIVYAGYSAGPCCLAPDLRGLEHCDDADEVRRICGIEPTWAGLGVLDRALVPHLDSPGHPETVLLGEVREGYRQAGLPYWALRDGDVLLVDGGLASARVLPRAQ